MFMLMFRRTALLYIVLAIVGFVICSKIEVNGNQIYPPFKITPLFSILQFFVFALWIFISAYITTRYATKLANNINDIFTQECDPYTFINKYENILKRRIGKSRTYVLINLSSGYLSIENSEKAKLFLDSIKNFPNNKVGIQNQIVFYRNLCSYYLQANDITNAEKMLEMIFSNLQNKKLPKRRYDWAHNCYIDTLYSINIAKGIFNGSEEAFSKQYNRGDNMLRKVVAKYQLGKMYMHFNRMNEAKKAFEYVINNGNKTYYVGKSIEFLSQCSEN